MEYYNSLLQGDQGALKRALYKSMGFTDEVLSKPLVAVVNSYTNATPGHFNLNILSERVQKGIEASGGTAMTFSTIAPCDGIAEGHIGMRYCLPSRDVIADSVECMVMAHKFDAMVLMGSCDKLYRVCLWRLQGLIYLQFSLTADLCILPSTRVNIMTEILLPKRLAGKAGQD